jgi:Zn-dependent protease with chaperone function
LIEITEAEQPRLFAFVRELTRETQTRFPKKIYISHEVNASVFYDSSFWSMFLPIRKNLHIGLGLVNSVTISEFKAVLAHEFGHFSQRSMKLGSYVYNLNHIIHNLLYENDGYEETLTGFASISQYFAVFAAINVKIIQGIQWILQQVYGVVNLQYMSLSRQMEFHADTVAASVSGANHLISSLRRLDTAGTAHQDVLSFYSKYTNEGLKPDNIFPQHREAMRLFAVLFGVPVENGIVQVDANTFERFRKTRVTIKDQWASHPSTTDREHHLRSLNIETPAQRDPAWDIFDNALELQQRATEHLFKDVIYTTPVQIVNEAAFIERYDRELNQYKLPAIYNGFYDSRELSITDLDKLNQQTAPAAGTIKDILTDDVLTLPYTIGGIEQDVHVLTAIQNNQLRIKSFEFNGQKYKAGQAQAVIDQLNGELKEAEKALKETDLTIAAWLLKKADARGQRETLLEKYKAAIQSNLDAGADVKIYSDLAECLQKLHAHMPYQELQATLAELKKREVVFKPRLALLASESSPAKPTEAERNQATEYLSKDWEYTGLGIDTQHNLDRLVECMYLFHQLSMRAIFHVKADVLQNQLTLAGIAAT